MGTVGNSLIKGIAPQQVSETLESFYAYEQLRAHFARAALNRLSGHGEIHLKTALENRVEEADGNSARLAARIAQLGGAVPADPTKFVELAPVDEYSLPDPNDMKVFMPYALEQERGAIRFYHAFLESIHDKDSVTYFEVFEILKVHIAVEDEIENFRK